MFYFCILFLNVKLDFAILTSLRHCLLWFILMFTIFCFPFLLVPQISTQVLFPVVVNSLSFYICQKNTFLLPFSLRQGLWAVDPRLADTFNTLKRIRCILVSIVIFERWAFSPDDFLHRQFIFCLHLVVNFSASDCWKMSSWRYCFKASKFRLRVTFYFWLCRSSPLCLWCSAQSLWGL